MKKIIITVIAAIIITIVIPLLIAEYVKPRGNASSAEPKAVSGAELM